MTTLKLTESQRQILEHGACNSDTRVNWFPDGLKGGARTKVLESLYKRGFIAPDPKGEGWCVTGEGAEAVGMHCGMSLDEADRAFAIQAESLAEMVKETQECTPPRRIRANSKQAAVIALLQRPEGATLGEICLSTGWQQHTVRGLFAGAFKKKLGLDIASSKEAGRDRVYRISRYLY